MMIKIASLIIKLHLVPLPFFSVNALSSFNSHKMDSKQRAFFEKQDLENF